MTETTKCTNCGAIVAAEKAFCPNCSEPMEPEEAANRVDSMSSEMMSTVRDDPESYKELLERLKQNRAAARQQAQDPGRAQAAPQPPPPAPQAAQPVPQAPQPAPPVMPAAPPPAGYGYQQPAQYNYPQAAHAYPAPPAKGGKLALVLGLAAVALLIIVLLFVFKVIRL